MAHFQISQEEYEAIKAAEAVTKDKRTSRNLKILMMRYEGFKTAEIARLMKIKVSSLSRICQRYREQGLEEFTRMKYTSHYRLLTEEQESTILKKYQDKAENGTMITIAEIKAAFDEACGKNTGNAYVYLVLKRHNWRKLMPRLKHPKAADKEVCDASKK